MTSCPHLWTHRDSRLDARAIMTTTRRVSSRSRLARRALAFVLVAACANVARAIEGKCSACRAVGKSLARALREDAESADQKVVDMRGRLDSRGKRYGKRISYKTSELRFVEILESVCDDDIGEYQFHEETNRWRIPPNPVKKIRKERGKQMKKEIIGYCHRVIEESEETLQSAVYDEKIDETNVEEFLCRNVSATCDASVDFTAEEPKENDYYHDEKAEQEDEKTKEKAKAPKSKKKSNKSSKTSKEQKEL